jgi:hypothetical protein
MRNVCVSLLCLLTLAVAGCGSDDSSHKPPVGFIVQDGPEVLAVQIGTRAELPVTVGRMGGHDGPLQVELRDLPEGVQQEPVVLSGEQRTAALGVTVGMFVPIDTYPVRLVVSDGLIEEAVSLSLEVRPEPATGAIVLTLDPESPRLLKGRTHEVGVRVSRIFGPREAFSIAPITGGLNVPALSVDASSESFHVPVTVAANLPVGRYPLVLSLRMGERSESEHLSVEVVAPEEGVPQLSAANPPDILRGAPSRITLSGSGLSGTTSVVLKPASGMGEPVQGDVYLAESGSVSVALRAAYGHALESAYVLELTTAAGTATLPFEVSTLHVDPATGSDTAGRGTRASPFATILKARGNCSSCVWPQCGVCPIHLAPGIHRPGRLDLHVPVALVGMGALYGDNPSVLEGQAGDRLTVTSVKLENLKVTGFDNGVEARSTLRDNTLLVTELTDVWLTGNGYGVLSQSWVNVSSRDVGSRIEDNRVAGIAAASTLKGTAAHPVEVTGNGDGSQNGGGLLGAVEQAEHVRVERNRGAGARVVRLTARDSTFRDNAGPGVWVVAPMQAFAIDLGTAASPGRNTLQGNTVNLRVDARADPAVSAVGNCWDAPSGSDFPEAVADGACGRLGTRFERDGVTYVDDQGRATVPFSWTGTPRFNYVLSQAASGAGAGIQF